MKNKNDQLQGVMSHYKHTLKAIRTTLKTIVGSCQYEQKRLNGTPQAQGFIPIEGYALEAIKWIDDFLK